MVLGLKVCSSSTEFTEAMNSESMIPGIKLFGRKILAPERHFPADSRTTTSESPTDSQISNVEYCGDSKVENPVKSPAARSSQSPNKGNLDPNEEEKTFKKPDKILPCPRCNSLETKFCYFNNYNVNQPRHFCKNCQRYWTAGGTMRNVPIGAGRRKNKQFASHYREACFSINGAASNKTESSDTTNHHHVSDVPSSEAKGTVLKFGPDNTCVSESVESCSELAASTLSYDRTLIHHPVHQQIPALFVPWNGNVGSFQWCSSPMVAIPGPVNVPLQLVAAPCVPMYNTSGGALGVFNGGHCFSSSSASNNGTLGKHSRNPNGGILESSCLVSKVAKIDGEFEARNSVSRSPLAGNIGVVGCGWKGECSGSDSRGSLG